MYKPQRYAELSKLFRKQPCETYALAPSAVQISVQTEQLLHPIVLDVLRHGSVVFRTKGPN